MDLRGIGSEDRRWIEPPQDHAQWWNLVLVVLDLRVLFRRNKLTVSTKGEQFSVT